MKNYKHVHRKGVLQRFVQTIALGMVVMMLYACAAPAIPFAFEEADQYFYQQTIRSLQTPMAESAQEYFFCVQPLSKWEYGRDTYIYARAKKGNRARVVCNKPGCPHGRPAEDYVPCNALFDNDEVATLKYYDGALYATTFSRSAPKSKLYRIAIDGSGSQYLGEVSGNALVIHRGFLYTVLDHYRYPFGSYAFESPPWEEVGLWRYDLSDLAKPPDALFQDPAQRGYSSPFVTQAIAMGDQLFFTSYARYGIGPSNLFKHDLSTGETREIFTRLLNTFTPFGEDGFVLQRTGDDYKYTPALIDLDGNVLWQIDALTTDTFDKIFTAPNCPYILFDNSQARSDAVRRGWDDPAQWPPYEIYVYNAQGEHVNTLTLGYPENTRALIALTPDQLLFYGEKAAGASYAPILSLRVSELAQRNPKSEVFFHYQ